MSKPIPHMTIGIIGPNGAGSTTLTSAITRVLSQSRSSISMLFSSVLDTAYSNKYISYEKMKETRMKMKKGGVLVNVENVRYVTPARVYECYDFPGEEEYIKGLISGATPVTALIVVLSATDTQSPSKTLGKYLHIAHESGIKKVVIFLNKADKLASSMPPATSTSATTSSELLGNTPSSAAVEKELREVLTEFRFDGVRTPIISGSALAALEPGVGVKRRTQSEIGERKVLELIRAADSWFDVPSRAINQPFLLPIEKIAHIPGRGTIATGRVERGIIRTGDAVDIVGHSEIQKSRTKGVEIFHKFLDTGHAGETIGCVLRGIKPETLEIGQIIAAPGSVATIKRFRGLVYILKQAEGGRVDAFSTTYRPRVMLRKACVEAALDFPNASAVENAHLKEHRIEQVNPGDHLEVDFDLERPLAAEVGVRFTMHEGSFIVGCGIVIKILQ